MSEWEKKPTYKDLIDDLFAAPKEEAKEEVKEVKPKPTKKINLPDAPEQTKEVQEISLKLAKEEMEHLRKAFLEFTDEVNDTVVYSYLYPYIEDFVEKCQQMETILKDNIDQDKLTEHGLIDYEEFKKIRGTILSVISEKYNRE